jgi:hypothetical protein
VLKKFHVNFYHTNRGDETVLFISEAQFFENSAFLGLLNWAYTKLG